MTDLMGGIDASSEEQTSGIVQVNAAVLRVYSHPEAFGWDRSIRMAIVLSDARARQIIGMAVQVAERDGWRFELFANEADGLGWLIPGNAACGP